MEFGTQAFFERLKAGIASGDQEFYNELDTTVERSIGHMVRSKIQYPDSDDVMQNIKTEVWLRISMFLNSSECSLPAQRNAWLKKVAASKISDFYRKRSLKQEVSLEETTDGGPSSGRPSESLLLREADRLINYRRCCRAISHICNLDMTPDRLLAVLYNGIIIPLSSAGADKKKGAPAALVRHFSGRPLSELRSTLWKALCFLFTSAPPESLLEPLDRKLQDGWADAPFRLTPREITLVTNRVKGSVKKHREQIMGGTLDE
ncbi:hypothetical protein [uncultured Pseudoflavonifractor sp.]|uniref:hypothetical protein n=1 Tax=uncultured Pseudoflavonifractor sp. TaxID=1221379 RepID=UPI0025EBD9B7|nr:hypothetical protein [uncultured Pseudoflavonifractor sp.]